MRKLIVQRKWRIIECGSRIMLSVSCGEDIANSKIDDKPFITMPIKNGKSIEIEICEEETIVYLSSSTMEVDYTIPAGAENVTLLAKPKYNPMQGNPFIITEIK